MAELKKTIGIVGGMGPAAGARLVALIAEKSPALRDQDQPTVILVNDPAVPDRTDYLLNKGADPAPALIKSVKRLELSGADIVAIACNTAHAPAILSRVLLATKLPIIDLVAEVAEACRQQMSGKPIGLLATSGTVTSGIYQTALAQVGQETVLPRPASQIKLMQTIYRVKAQGATNSDAYTLLELAAETINQGAAAIILGCTELSLIKADFSVPILDSLDILANRLIELSKPAIKVGSMHGNDPLGTQI